MASLTTAIASTLDALQSFAHQDHFWDLFETAFGSGYDRPTAESLRSQWLVGDVDGGAGTDTITYADLSSITTALTIDKSGTGIFTQANGTTIRNVERFSELTTGFGNDTIGLWIHRCFEDPSFLGST